MLNVIIEKLSINVDSQEVDVVHLPWKTDSAKQLTDGQANSTTQINIRTVTPSKKNGKISKENPSAGIYMEGSKEASRSSDKRVSKQK
jgi:hypothetical protein